MNALESKINEVQRNMIDALRIVISSAGAMHYAAYENLKPICNKLKELDNSRRVPFFMDYKKDLEKIISLAENLNTRIKLRFVGDNSQEAFENIAFGLFQCISMLAVKPENEIYHEAIRLSEMELTYNSLPEQIKFLESVLNRSRKSNHDAFKMIQERLEILRSLNIHPFSVAEDGNVKVLDIVPVKEVIESYH